MNSKIFLVASVMLCILSYASSMNETEEALESGGTRILVDWSTVSQKNPDFAPGFSCNILSRGPEPEQTFYCLPVFTPPSSGFNSVVLKVTLAGHVSLFADLTPHLDDPSTWNTIGGPLRATWVQDDTTGEWLLYCIFATINAFFNEVGPDRGILILNQDGILVDRIRLSDPALGVPPGQPARLSTTRAEDGLTADWVIPTGLVVTSQDSANHKKGTIYVVVCKVSRLMKFEPKAGGGYTFSIVRDLGPFAGEFQPPLPPFIFDWAPFGLPPTGANSLQLSDDETSLYTVNTDSGLVLKVDLTKQSAADLTEATILADFDKVTVESVLVDEDTGVVYVAGANEAGDGGPTSIKLGGKVFAFELSSPGVKTDTPSLSPGLIQIQDHPDGMGEQEEMAFTDNKKKILITTIDIRCLFAGQIDFDEERTDVPGCTGGTIRIFRSKVDFDE